MGNGYSSANNDCHHCDNDAREPEFVAQVANIDTALPLSNTPSYRTAVIGVLRAATERRILIWSQVKKIKRNRAEGWFDLSVTYRRIIISTKSEEVTFEVAPNRYMVFRVMPTFGTDLRKNVLVFKRSRAEESFRRKSEEDYANLLQENTTGLTSWQPFEKGARFAVLEDPGFMTTLLDAFDPVNQTPISVWLVDDNGTILKNRRGKAWKLRFSTVNYPLQPVIGRQKAFGTSRQLWEPRLQFDMFEILSLLGQLSNREEDEVATTISRNQLVFYAYGDGSWSVVNNWQVADAKVITETGDEDEDEDEQMLGKQMKLGKIGGRIVLTSPADWTLTFHYAIGNQHDTEAPDIPGLL